MSLGPITFLAPWVLLGLLALPLIWWLLKVMPPAPKQQVFPPLRILQGVVTEEETPNSTPLWLLLLRMLMIALLTVALAMPVIDRAEGAGADRFTLLVDNSWAGATVWGDITDEARAMLGEARRENAEVRLQPLHGDTADFGPAQAAIDALDRLQPQPFAPALPDGLDGDIRYLSGGIGDEPADATVFSPPQALRVVMLGQPEELAEGFQVPVHRAHRRGVQTHRVDALAGDGTVLATEEVEWIDGATRAEARFDLPSEIRNRVTRLEVAGVRSAAAVRLLDDNWGRPVIGVLNIGQDTASPLLSEPFYARTALAPNADIYEGDLDTLLQLSPSVLVMPDAARTTDPALRAWVETGGLLVRFAGEKMAERPDDLIPVAVRIGGRALGGALTWEEPQTLGPFPASSPFAGLDIPDDISVTRQIMAEPGTETDSRTWARLEDGSPVVTTDALGQGRIVMFHVTAGPEWSNLAVSGLYVDMLKRLLPLAKSNRVAAGGDVAEGTEFAPERLLDGFGQLTTPGLGVSSITEATAPSPDAPPGYYRQGSRRLALNAVADPSSYAPLDGTAYGRTADRRLGGLLLTLAALLLAADVLWSMIATGRRPRIPALPAKAAATAIFAAALLSPDALAQDAPPPEALDLHLAYVVTGDDRLDRRSEEAMEGVMEALNGRTTILVSGVTGVVPGVDELTYHPFLFFPVRRSSTALDPAAVEALNRYMAAGGTVVFDTADFADSALTPGVHPGLQQVTQGLDIPRLAPVPDDHVLTKSFYLLQVFPGRWANGDVWVGTDLGGTNDGVSPVIIGSNDWAAAWASGPDGGPVVSLENDIPRQREMAQRFAVNLGMYALAGNYKGDQVHTARLVERLGEDRGDVVRPGVVE